MTTWAISATDVRQAQEVALERAPVGTARLDKPLQLVGAPPHLPAADQGADERRPLPGVVAVDLRHRGAEALPKLRLQGVQDLPLALQVVRLVQVQPHLD